MKKLSMLIGVVTLVALCFAAAASAAPLQNGNFETGTLAGWDTSTDSGSVVVTTGVDDGSDASQFALVTAGNQDSWQSVSQTFDATAGKTLHLQTAFRGAETEEDGCGTYDDQGQVTIDDGGSTSTVFSTDACTTIGFGGWQVINYKVAHSGEITVTAEVRNIGDNVVSSQMYLDNVGFGSTSARPAQVDYLGYCSVAGNTYPSTGQPIQPGTFLQLKAGQVDTDPNYKGATPAIYVEGEGMTAAAACSGETAARRSAL